MRRTMESMAGPPNTYKVCPDCGQKTYLDAQKCGRCNHSFRTKFQDPSNQTQAFSNPYGYSAYPQWPDAVPDNGTEGFAVASLVLGILSVLGCCAWFFSLPCSILAVVFAFIARDSRHRGMAVAGGICGALGLAAWAFWFFIFASMMAAGAG